jgi:hypothetical protein
MLILISIAARRIPKREPVCTSNLATGEHLLAIKRGPAKPDPFTIIEVESDPIIFHEPPRVTLMQKPNSLSAGRRPTLLGMRLQNGRDSGSHGGGYFVD